MAAAPIPDFTQASQLVNDAATEIQQQFQALNTTPAVQLQQIAQHLQQIQRQLYQINQNITELRSEIRAS